MDSEWYLNQKKRNKMKRLIIRLSELWRDHPNYLVKIVEEGLTKKSLHEAYMYFLIQVKTAEALKNIFDELDADK